MDGETPGFTPPQDPAPQSSTPQDSAPQTPPASPAGSTPPPVNTPPVSGKSPFGSRNVIIAIIVVVLVVVGGVAYWNQQQQEKELQEFFDMLDDFEDYDYDYDYDYEYETGYDTSYGERDSYLSYESVTPGYYTYSDLKYWFDMDYPMDWELDVDDSIVAVTFLSPYSDDLDYFAENVNVTTEDISWYGPMTLDEYGEASMEQIELALPGYEIVEIRDSWLGNHEAQYILGSYVMGSFDTRIMSAFTLVDGTAYVVTYTYEAGNADLYQDVVDYMMTTFEVW